MDHITQASHISFSISGAAFFQSHRSISEYSGSSKYYGNGEQIIEKGPSQKRRISLTRKKREIKGYRINKSKVLQKAAAFYNLKSSRKFMAFYSVSFPIGMTDKTAMKCMNIWLTRVRKLNRKVNYLWIAERQKNGTIHFHALMDKWLNIRVVNWYMSKAIDGVIKSDNVKGLNFNRSKYNGVDVERVYNGKGVSKYLVKYMAKGSDQTIDEKGVIHRPFDCRSIGMSRLVSALFTKVIESFYDGIEKWPYFKRDDPSSPFEYSIRVSEFAFWVPYKFGLPPDINKRLCKINDSLVDIFRF